MFEGVECDDAKRIAELMSRTRLAMSRFDVRTWRTSRHFVARQNSVAIGVIADIERATPIERALSSAIKSPSRLDTQITVAGSAVHRDRTMRSLSSGAYSRDPLAPGERCAASGTRAEHALAAVW
jgi:hypothetical protein